MIRGLVSRRRRGRHAAPPPLPKPPITRREYLTREAIRVGIDPLFAAEAVSSVALSHPEGYMDQLVDPDTGEPIKLARPAAPSG